MIICWIKCRIISIMQEIWITLKVLISKQRLLSGKTMDKSVRLLKTVVARLKMTQRHSVGKQQKTQNLRENGLSFGPTFDIVLSASNP